MNIKLDQADFRALVRGEVIEKRDRSTRVLIALEDLGWHAMQKAIMDAVEATQADTKA